jgi:uncharacterized membrane-anchored protein
MDRLRRRSMRRHAQVVVLAALLVAVPLVLAGWNEWRKRAGEHILIRVEPVDPYDPFRGEYVALGYRISRVSHPDAEVVYVRLHRDGIAWTGSRAVATRPASGTFIRGRVHGGSIDYGIETFYVQEGTARRYEKAVAHRRLYADVVLHDDGSAQLDDLVIR